MKGTRPVRLPPSPHDEASRVLPRTALQMLGALRRDFFLRRLCSQVEVADRFAQATGIG